MVNIDWHALRSWPTSDIIRAHALADGAGAGVLWSSNAVEVALSAYGVLAWEGREGRPDDPRYEWAGYNLLCNAAPTSFVLEGERFLSVESFHEALKFPERTADRDACALASALDARRLARGLRKATFVYRGEQVSVNSAEHEGLVAAAICAKVAQNLEVQSALRDTGNARLLFPLTYGDHPGVLARVTPLVLMIERWKRWPTAV